MAFGLAFPFTYSPLFDGFELFSQPRYIRRPYAHLLSALRCQPHFHHYSRGFPSTNVLDLLNFGSDFFPSEWDHILGHLEDKVAEPTTAKEQKHDSNKSDAPVSEIASSSGTPTVKKVVAPPTVSTGPISKKLGEVSTLKNAETVKYEVAFPGLSQEDIKLDLDTQRKALIVKADKVFEEKSDTRKTYKRVSFTRMLPLEEIPEDAAKSIKADFVDGTLHITVSHNAVEAASAPAPISAPPSAIEAAPENQSLTLPEEKPKEVEVKPDSEPQASSSANPTLAPTSVSEATSHVVIGEPQFNSNDEATVEDAEE